MKKRTTLSTLVALTLTALGVVSFKKTKRADPEIKAIIQTSTENCNATTYQIYPEAMTLWNTTWNAYYNANNADTTDHGIRTIKAENLSKLYGYIGSSVSGNTGVRMFYGLVNETDSIPDLFLVNTVDCKGRTDDPILMVRPLDAAGVVVNEWLSRDVALKFINNWASQERRDGETEVYAYNYSWDQLWSLLGSESTQDLNIIYGLRTLSPQENETDFANVEEGGLYGSIVYVNVLYTSDDNDPVRTETDPIFDDFTRPCPKFCDPDSTIVTVNR